MTSDSGYSKGKPAYLYELPNKVMYIGQYTSGLCNVYRSREQSDSCSLFNVDFKSMEFCLQLKWLTSTKIVVSLQKL